MTERKLKTIFQLDTPFTAVEWPKISEKDQKLIFELLCNTLAPIGHHRANHVASKGKRSRKRKRREAKKKALLDANNETRESNEDKIPPPEIQKFVVVGLNSILRHLHSLSQVSKSKQPGVEAVLEIPANLSEKSRDEDANELAQLKPFAAIFALTPTPASPTILTTHLPTLIHTSSLIYPSLPSTRLIPLSQSQAIQLQTVLSLARTSHIGILDSALGAEALIAVIRENVPEIEVRWLNEVHKGEYLEMRINAIETYAGVSRKEMREKD